MGFDSELKTIAESLVKFCQNDDARTALSDLYAENAVSVEALDMSGMGRETHGVAGIKGKHDWWEGAHEIHSSTAEGPFLFGADRFGVIFEMDVTHKESGQRHKGRELGIYTVDGGKIVREEFFYAA